ASRLTLSLHDALPISSDPRFPLVVRIETKGMVFGDAIHRDICVSRYNQSTFVWSMFDLQTVDRPSGIKTPSFGFYRGSNLVRLLPAQPVVRRSAGEDLSIVEHHQKMYNAGILIDVGYSVVTGMYAFVPYRDHFPPGFSVIGSSF